MKELKTKLHGTQPPISIVVWSDELSVLKSRMDLTPSEFVKLKSLVREEGRRLFIDIDLRNTAPVFNALRRRLAGDGGG